jgi:transposase-like protein
MAVDQKLIDELLRDYKKPEDIIGENGPLKELTKAILERALQAEMSDHLGYKKHDPVGTTGATRATARAERPCRASSARWSWRRCATASQRSSP